MIRGDISPSIQPVNVSRITSDAAPTCNHRNQVKLIVLRKELGRRVVQSIPSQAFSETSSWYEPFSVSAPTHIEFVNDARVKYVNPVRRSSIIRVEIVRANTPPINPVGSVGPTRSCRPLII